VLEEGGMSFAQGNDEVTFRRYNGKSCRWVESCIDHVLSKNMGDVAKMTVSGDVYDNDHLMVVGCIRSKVGKSKVKMELMEVGAKFSRRDGGMVKKFKEKMKGLSYDGAKGTRLVEAITRKSIEVARSVMGKRNNRRNVDGWSPISRYLQLSFWGCVDMKRAMYKGGGRFFLKRVFKRWRKEELRLHLTDEEKGMVSEDGSELWGSIEVYGDAVNGTCIDKKIRRVKRLLRGRRREEYRALYRDRVVKMDVETDSGRIGSMMGMMLLKTRRRSRPEPRGSLLSGSIGLMMKRSGGSQWWLTLGMGHGRRRPGS
jgi:hypothetical protein